MKVTDIRRFWHREKYDLATNIAMYFLVYYQQSKHFLDADCKKMFINNIDLNDADAVEKESLRIANLFYYKNENGEIIPLFIGIQEGLRYLFYRSLLVSKNKNERISTKQVNNFTNSHAQHFIFSMRDVIVKLVLSSNTEARCLYDP